MTISKREYETLYRPVPLESQSYPILTTAEEITAEILKCRCDPAYFLDTYGVVKDPVKGLVPFKLYEFQKQALRDLVEFRSTIFLKSRQMGISTLVGAFALWLTMFWPDKKVCVISTKQDKAKEFLDIPKLVYQYVPSWLKPYPTKINEGEFAFENGSTIVGSTTTGDSGRSSALSLLIIDEAAFIDRIDETWASAQPTLSRGGRSINISTPRGLGTWFHKQWVNSSAGKTGMKPIQLHWSQHPDYDQAWYESQCRLLGDPRLVAQELDLAFLGSGETLIPVGVLNYYLPFLDEPPDTDDDGVCVWEQPSSEDEYIICADVSSGMGNDFSTFHILRKRDLMQMAEYQGKVLPVRFAKLLKDYGERYNYGTMAVEINGYGLEVNDRLFNEHGYECMYVNDKNTIGWRTQANTKPLMISALETLLSQRRFKMRSRRLWNELTTLNREGSKVEAQRGYNDDLVMALSIGLAIYQKEVMSGAITDDLGGEVDGERMYRQQIVNFRSANVQEPVDDFKWVRAVGTRS